MGRRLQFRLLAILIRRRARDHHLLLSDERLQLSHGRRRLGHFVVKITGGCPDHTG